GVTGVGVAQLLRRTARRARSATAATYRRLTTAFFSAPSYALVVFALDVDVRIRILSTRQAVELHLDWGNPPQLCLEFCDHHFDLRGEPSNRAVSGFGRRPLGTAWATTACDGRDDS